MLSPSYGHIKPTAEVHFQSNPQSHSSCQIYCYCSHSLSRAGGDGRAAGRDDGVGQAGGTGGETKKEVRKQDEEHRECSQDSPETGGEQIMCETVNSGAVLSTVFSPVFLSVV